MSVIGIDVGSQTCYVAVARQGGIETIANECSDRCTPAVISLGERSRFMGAAAKSQMISNFKNTIWGWKHLVGQKFNDPIVQHETKFLSVDVVEGHNRSVAIKVSYLGAKHTFNIEQVMAMMLSKIKQVSEMALQAKVIDCVLNVPCYYTDIQRRSVLDAAALAGLNVHQLLNDTTATALTYGLYKQDLPSASDQTPPRRVVFIDMGHSDIQLAVCAFNKDRLQILATASDPRLGGSTIDRLIADHFCIEFKNRYRINVHSSPKAYLRLLQECEKLKKLMSANTQEIPLSIECFMDDKDVTGKMSRDTMERLASPLLGQIETLMRDVLARARLSVDDIASVEIVGGSSRVPAVKDLVRKVYGREASVTLNGDEAVARGCALQCAILSPSFRVRDFTVLDIQQYPIMLSYHGGFNNDEINTTEIFKELETIPCIKQLTFYRQQPFTIEAKYNSPNIPTANSLIGTFLIDKVVAQRNGGHSKVKVKIGVDNNGILIVSDATMLEPIIDALTPITGALVPVCTSLMPIEVEILENGETGRGRRLAEDGETNMEVDHDGEMINAGISSSESDMQQSLGSDNPKVKVIELPIVAHVPQMSSDELNVYIGREIEMLRKDRLEKERMDARNVVEEYVYEMRKQMADGGDLQQYIKDKDRVKFLSQLDDMEQWLYGSGQDQSQNVYVEKLNTLKKVGDAVCNRQSEHTSRPRAIQILHDEIQRVTQIIDAINRKDAKYAHLESSDAEALKRAVHDKQKWFDKCCSNTQHVQLYDDPHITIQQIETERQSLISSCNSIVSKCPPSSRSKAERDSGASSGTNNEGRGSSPRESDESSGGGGRTTRSRSHKQ